jgi:cellulose synthase/poly-beta-1,6-N-acetylglucosamine synthase-like glycosyltransferase
MSVVIAAKDAADTLAEQLDALLPQAWSGSWEIVVVDNGSTDTTREIVRSFESRCRRVRLVEATNRSGAGYARNVAMRASSARAFAFCDADDIVTAGWVSAMGDGLRRHEAVGGSVELQLLNAPWLQTAYYASPPQRLETFEGIFPFAATCSLGVRRSVIEHVGGFDEDFVTGQDMELCTIATGRRCVRSGDAACSTALWARRSPAGYASWAGQRLLRGGALVNGSGWFGTCRVCARRPAALGGSWSQARRSAVSSARRALECSTCDPTRRRRRAEVRRPLLTARGRAPSAVHSR